MEVIYRKLLKIGMELPDDTYTHPSLEKSAGEDVTLCTKHAAHLYHTRTPTRDATRLHKHTSTRTYADYQAC